jgi:HPt (histidine-containing phosphotransfer) domain-containing protein
MTHAVEADAFAAHLAAIWRRARPTVLARLQTIEHAAVASASGSLSPDERNAAEQESHKIAGIAGALGFPSVTTYAREAELLLRGAGTLDASQSDRLCELVRLCRAELDAAPAFDHGLAASPRTITAS